MKKILIFVVSIVLFCSVFTTTIFADGITFTGNSTSCNPGSTVTVQFSVGANSNIAAATFNVLYDSSVFTYDGYERGTAFSNGLSAVNDISKGTFLYAYIDANGITKGGPMFSVRFKVSNKAQAGKKYAITLSTTELSDKSYKKLTANNTVAYVTINGSASDSGSNTGSGSTTGNGSNNNSSTVSPPVSSKPNKPSSNSSGTSSSVSNTVIGLDSSNATSNTGSSVTSEVSSINSNSSSDTFYNDLPEYITNTDTDVTQTDTDSNSIFGLLSSNFLSTAIIVLSILAFLSVALMIALIIKAHYINKKE